VLLGEDGRVSVEVEEQVVRDQVSPRRHADSGGAPGLSAARPVAGPREPEGAWVPPHAVSTDWCLRRGFPLQTRGWSNHAPKLIDLYRKPLE